MPKKRLPTYDTKPSSPAHPSLGSSKPKDGAGNSSSGLTVNDKIQQLRIDQSPRTRPDGGAFNPAANPSLPPSVRNILQLPDAPAPRPRPNLRIAGGRLRVPAGPAAPASWTRKNTGRAREAKARATETHDASTAQAELLPGSWLPAPGSLVSTTLIAIARDWDWHKEYDQYYLATIPVRYKEALLHYISLHNTHGIDLAGINVLFLDSSELEDATGAEGLTHFNLSRSIGYSLKISDLRLLFTASIVESVGEESGKMPESWDDSPPSSQITRQPSALGRFDSLTHLSLARPGPTAVWKSLLEIAPLLATITHLSLAYWPTPTLSPNSLTAYRETPSGNVSYGASHYYSALDRDFSEAASILRRLSKYMYCLQYLDLTRCHPWLYALAEPQIDWHGAWRALTTVKVAQGWLPEPFQSEEKLASMREMFDIRASSVETVPHEREKIVQWVQTEAATLATEKIINAGMHAANFPVDKRGVNTNPINMAQMSDWHGLAFRHFDASTLGSVTRTERVRFERDWDEWWVREAIVEIAKRWKDGGEGVVSFR